MEQQTIMSPKTKRKLSKGTRKRYASSHPRPQVEMTSRVRKPEPTAAERILRKRIQQFAYHGDRFKADFEKAIELYFEQKPSKSVPLYFDDDELPAFMEWYFFDFVTRNGRRIIDMFTEETGPSLNAPQREMLDDWLVWNRARLLEFQEVKPGVGVVVQDLLSNETFEVNDISASYNVVRWTFGLFRPIRSAGRVSFTGSAAVLPPSEKEGVLKTARSLWTEYQAKHRSASLSDFYRDHSLDLYKAVKRAQEEASKPPIPLSAEGHPLVLAKARYLIRSDRSQVEAALDASEEFIYTGPSEERRGALHYNWIQRGRSFVPQSEQKPKGRAVLLKTEWTEGPGQPSYLNLGDLSVATEWIELECVSRQRLAAGKALLESILGGQIRHSGDRYEDWEATLDKPDSRPGSSRQRPSRKWKQEGEAIQEDMLQRMTRDWLDQPSMDGKLTPRQAAKTPEGRKRLIEILKQIEYHNDLRLREGEPPTMDADYIRRELGL